MPTWPSFNIRSLKPSFSRGGGIADLLQELFKQPDIRYIDYVGPDPDSFVFSNLICHPQMLYFYKVPAFSVSSNPLYLHTPLACTLRRNFVRIRCCYEIQWQENAPNSTGIWETGVASEQCQIIVLTFFQEELIDIPTHWWNLTVSIKASICDRSTRKAGEAVSAVDAGKWGRTEGLTFQNEKGDILNGKPVYDCSDRRCSEKR